MKFMASVNCDCYQVTAVFEEKAYGFYDCMSRNVI